MSNTMQLTEKNLMVGDWVESNYGTIEVPEWKPMQLRVSDLVLVSTMTESFNKHRRPIPLTEDVLRKIEGVKYDREQNGYFVTENLLVRVMPASNDCTFYDVHFFTYTPEETNCICIVDEDEYYLHQLQQLCRCLGHELVINF